MNAQPWLLNHYWLFFGGKNFCLTFQLWPPGLDTLCVGLHLEWKKNSAQNWLKTHLRPNVIYFFHFWGADISTLVRKHKKYINVFISIIKFQCKQGSV